MTRTQRLRRICANHTPPPPPLRLRDLAYAVSMLALVVALVSIGLGTLIALLFTLKP